jgi:hypothetical protein
MSGNRGQQVWRIFTNVVDDLENRDLPNLTIDHTTAPAMVVFSKGEYNLARVMFAQVWTCTMLELVLLARPPNVIRMQPDTDRIRMMLPVQAHNLASMFCGIWLSFRRAVVNDQSWSLHDITCQYRDVAATPAFRVAVRRFGHLVFGQEDLQLANGIDVRLQGRTIS